MTDSDVATTAPIGPPVPFDPEFAGVPDQNRLAQRELRQIPRDRRVH